MLILRRRLDIDRWMCRIRCGCGSEFWFCEKRPLVCPGCKATRELKELLQEFRDRGGKDE